MSRSLANAKLPAGRRRKLLAVLEAGGRRSRTRRRRQVGRGAAFCVLVLVLMSLWIAFSILHEYMF